MTNHLRFEVDGGVGRLMIDRAERRNALTLAMWQELPRLVEKAMADPMVRVLVISGADPGPFCAGADIGEFAAHAADPAWRAQNNAAIRTTQVTIARSAKPVVAAIDGDCIGGGLGIALACDVRISSRHGRFGLTPAKLGLVYPLHDTKLLVDLVGPAQAKRMLFTARIFDATEALRIGVIDDIADDLDAAVTAFTDAVCAASSHTQLAAKAIVARIQAGAADDDAGSMAQFDAAFDGPDFAEGVAAFLDKRRPNFR